MRYYSGIHCVTPIPLTSTARIDEHLRRKAKMKFFQLSIFDSIFGSTRPRPKMRPKKRRAAPRQDVQLLISVWQSVAQQYFPGRSDILSYSVSWSNRPQKRTLASCNIRQRRVVVASELNYPDHHRWLEALLYHEMCHAVLGMNIEKTHGRRQWHGAQFRELERRHPGIAHLDQWIKSGGWRFAVRSHRSKVAHSRRRITE